MSVRVYEMYSVGLDPFFKIDWYASPHPLVGPICFTTTPTFEAAQTGFKKRFCCDVIHMHEHIYIYIILCLYIYMCVFECLATCIKTQKLLI